MQHDLSVDSGIPIIGEIPWGTHFCNFYETEEDLWSVLVPYFQTGLANNEFCGWLATSETQKSVLMKVMEERIPGFQAFVQKGQMQFFNWADMPCPCEEDLSSLLAPILVLESEKRAAGYRGIRMSGATIGVFKGRWDIFAKYEMSVNEAICNRKIIGLCSYPLKEYKAHAIFDIIKTHQFALVLRDKRWELIESAVIKKLKNELQKMNHELEDRVLERTKKLEQALKARDQFFSVVSHELRTPLTCMRLYVDAMLFSGDFSRPAELENVFKKIQEQNICLENLINRLLEVAFRPSEDDFIFEIKPEKMDLGELVRKVVKRFSEDLKKTDCRVKIESDSPVVGCWDKIRIDQVVSHLMNNVLKHVSCPRLTISVTQEDKLAKLVFRDDGPGIQDKDRPHIFDLFWQGTQETTVPSFGIGLWLVKKIIEAHQGTIKLREDISMGSCFEVRLPLFPDENAV